jgi:hypothetical protein
VIVCETLKTLPKTISGEEGETTNETLDNAGDNVTGDAGCDAKGAMSSSSVSGKTMTCSSASAQDDVAVVIVHADEHQDELSLE